MSVGICLLVLAGLVLYFGLMYYYVSVLFFPLSYRCEETESDQVSCADVPPRAEVIRLSDYRAGRM
jgi:hypothetical protein